jgi:hypothetical protein
VRKNIRLLPKPELARRTAFADAIRLRRTTREIARRVSRAPRRRLTMIGGLDFAAIYVALGFMLWARSQWGTS